MVQNALNSTSSQRIPVIGIVGGVGSGKSSVAKTLAERVSVALIDADRLGHQALELPEVKDRLRQRFGEDIFDDQGAVVRKKLAARVFGDSPEQQTARVDLERISHPEIARLAEAQIDEHRRKNDVRWIILDAAILLESGWQPLCDLVVFVDVSAQRRLENVRTQRGWTEADWRRREASQWPVAQKRAAADLVISNEDTLETAAERLQSALEERLGQ